MGSGGISLQENFWKESGLSRIPFWDCRALWNWLMDWALLWMCRSISG